ncbi:phosphoribosyltransferase [Robertkochia solimangrovi]|uniref:phosphoribosyltransferase n=1 Tax=Robertkochia solimangrovi TaxID=2213046 RepID=UPI001F5571A8|nr:phosphoribosyltransferase family protein [Robertkochia solimangrovi]
MFTDRKDAGKKLARKLKYYKGSDAVILAIPRGGLPIGAAIAELLHLPLDVVLSKKIGHPLNKEFAIGAVSLNSTVLGAEAGQIPSSYIDEETRKIHRDLQKKMEMYYQGNTPVNLKGKTLIVTDDGIATGNTILATVALLAREDPDKIIIAVPVSSVSAQKKISQSPYVDQMISLITPYNFNAVGSYYHNFLPVSDSEAIRLLQTFSNPNKNNTTKTDRAIP